MRVHGGPKQEPPLTRTEMAFPYTADDWWSAPASFEAIAAGAVYMRREAARTAPQWEYDAFTPVCFWLRGDTDGDCRSVIEPNGAYRPINSRTCRWSRHWFGSAAEIRKSLTPSRPPRLVTPNSSMGSSIRTWRAP